MIDDNMITFDCSSKKGQREKTVPVTHLQESMNQQLSETNLLEIDVDPTTRLSASTSYPVSKPSDPSLAKLCKSTPDHHSCPMKAAYTYKTRSTNTLTNPESNKLEDVAKVANYLNKSSYTFSCTHSVSES